MFYISPHPASPPRVTPEAPGRIEGIHHGGGQVEAAIATPSEVEAREAMGKSPWDWWYNSMGK